MTQPQPGFTTLNQVYTRALSILGVVSPGGRATALSLGVTPVSLISDVSDASVPHQNPIYGISVTTTAVVGEFSIVQLSALARMLRVRRITVIALGTSPRLELLGTAAAVLATVQVAATPGFSLGPSVIPGNASARGGVNAGAAILDNNAFRPDLSSFDFRPPFLIAPGQTLCYEDQSTNTQISLSILWEEIPLQTDVEDLGFPA